MKDGMVELLKSGDKDNIRLFGQLLNNFSPEEIWDIFVLVRYELKEVMKLNYTDTLPMFFITVSGFYIHRYNIGVYKNETGVWIRLFQVYLPMAVHNGILNTPLSCEDKLYTEPSQDFKDRVIRRLTE